MGDISCKIASARSFLMIIIDASQWRSSKMRIEFTELLSRSAYAINLAWKVSHYAITSTAATQDSHHFECQYYGMKDVNKPRFQSLRRSGSVRKRLVGNTMCVTDPNYSALYVSSETEVSLRRRIAGAPVKICQKLVFFEMNYFQYHR